MARFLPAAPTRLSNILTPTTWFRLGGSWLVVVLFTLFGSDWLGEPLDWAAALIVFAVLITTILVASFGVVQEADHLAHQLGEPYGTLVLTLAVVLIEVVLILSVLLGPGRFPTIGRDSIFAVIMIVLNLVMGICLIAGFARHGGQTYNAQGTTSYLSLIAGLTGIGLVLPNYTQVPGRFTAIQALGVSVLFIALYSAFLWLQTGRQRHHFVQPPVGSLSLQGEATLARDNRLGTAHSRPALLIRSGILLALILPIILLAHHLAGVTDYGIAAIGAPVAVSGVLIAIIVFTPESITAVRAAMHNEMQRAINLCLGAIVSTVGLTMPAVLLIGLITGKPVVMDITALDTALFAITTALTLLSFNGQPTSPIQGLLHLALFAVFGLLLFYP